MNVYNRMNDSIRIYKSDLTPSLNRFKDIQKKYNILTEKEEQQH